MRNQEKIFVIGHKNPDTDSICSAIAYADIKNRTSQKVKYIPKRAGQINEETEYVLNRFGMQPPGYLSNIGTQIKDMDIRMSPEADKSMSLKNAWDLMMEKSIVSLPIRDREGQLEGLSQSVILPRLIWIQRTVICCQERRHSTEELPRQLQVP